ncbi:single-stranded DNA-binding protein [Salinisphaera sp. SPP-AMP-43]|uniref:single-stranded DNA-binding protein n=1 Tax=Salinisphaera sp. SPP-AMP-43 TaxID=3121288 RepID=UPI003C6E8E10
MFQVEIHSSRVNVKEGTSARTQRSFRIREQVAFIYLNDEPYPQKIKLTLGDSQEAYEPGKYELTPEFYVGNFGDLRLGMRDAIMEPIAESKPKAVNS